MPVTSQSKCWRRIGSKSTRIICLLAAGELLVGACSSSRSAAVPASLAPPNANSPEVIDILEKHIAAIGGREAHKAIKTIETEREVELYNSVRTTREVRDKETGRFYSKTVEPSMTIETGFDGTRVWQKTPFFKGYLADGDPQAQNLRRRRRELYEYRETGQLLTRLPDETVEGKHLIVLETHSSDLDPLGREVPVKYYLDPQIFLLRRTVVGSEIKQTTEFDDYRRVDGIVQAFRTKVTTPQITITTTLKRVQHNVPIDTALFEYEVGPPAALGAASAARRPAAPQSVPAVPFFRPDEALPEKIRLDTLELVWSTVNDTYWDASFGGLNWEAVHQKYLAPAKATARSDEFHELLNEMLAQLDRSHLKVQPPDKTSGVHTTTAELNNGSVGLDLRWLDGELLVFDVKKDFPGDRAGLKRGSRILRINGKDAGQLLAAYNATRKGFALKEEIQRVRAAIEELSGAPGTDVTLEVSDAGEQVRQVKLTRRARPTELMEFESRKIADDIGYIRFNIFMGDVLTQSTRALYELRETTGLVIDLRGNPGGIGHLTTALATLLCSEPGTLGSSTSRYGKQEHSYAGGGKESYRGRIAILVDEMTGSAAEVFSGGLQDTKRATIIGSTTAGAVLPSMVKILPTGGSLQHVIADFKTSSGIALEGRGVIPDIAVKPTRQAWLSGKDPVLDRAIRFLRSNA